MRQHPEYKNAECVTCGEVGMWLADHEVFCCGTCGDSYQASGSEIIRSQIQRFFHEKMKSLSYNEEISSNEDVECMTCNGVGLWVAEDQAFCCSVCGDVYESHEHDILQSQISSYCRWDSTRKLKNSTYDRIDCTTCGEAGVWIAEHNAFCCEKCGDTYEVTRSELHSDQVHKFFQNKMIALSSLPLNDNSQEEILHRYENVACTLCGDAGVWIAENDIFCCVTCGETYEESSHNMLQGQINDFNENQCKTNREKKALKLWHDYENATCLTCGETGIWLAEDCTFCCESCGDSYQASRHDICRQNIKKYFHDNVVSFQSKLAGAVHRDESEIEIHNQSEVSFLGQDCSHINQTDSPRCICSFDKLCETQFNPRKRSDPQQLISPINPRVLEYSSPKNPRSQVSSQKAPGRRISSIGLSPDHQHVLETHIDYKHYIAQMERRAEQELLQLEIGNTTTTKPAGTLPTQKKKKKPTKKLLRAKYKKCEQVFLKWVSSKTSISLPLRSVSELVLAVKKLHDNTLHSGVVLTVPVNVNKSLNDAIKLRKKEWNDRGRLHWLRSLKQCRSYLVECQKVVMQRKKR